MILLQLLTSFQGRPCKLSYSSSFPRKGGRKKRGNVNEMTLQLVDYGAMADGRVTLEMQIPFADELQAEIACNTLGVDAEPKRGGLIKHLKTNGHILHVSMSATEARKLRVGANSFMDHLLLTIETIEKFSLKASA